MKKIYTLLFFTISISFFSLSQNVNIITKIDGFYHNWDCCNDGNPFGGCFLGNKPDPRYRVWVGYNGGNFLNYTSNPGLYSGCGNTYGADEVDCSVWNPGVITGPTLTGNATSLNVEMESWEEDGCGSNCDKNTCGVFGNDDDTRCGQLRIGDISFLNYAPCTDHTFSGAFTNGTFLSMHNRCGDNNGAGYGIQNFIVNWNFAVAPTIVTQPDNVIYGGGSRESCTTLPITLTVVSNAKTGGTTNWTLARWVKWQSAPTSTGPWTDIPATLNTSAYTTQTTFTYTFTPSSPGTTYYRAVLSSLCSSGFASQTVNSNPVEVIVYDNATNPFCTSPACNISYVDPVGGNDVTGNGRPSNPYKSISVAANAGATYIRVAKCASGCVETSIVNIPSNCVIEGGYVRNPTFPERWSKSSGIGDRTFITFSGEETISGVRHIAAFKSSGVSGWTVKDLNITTSNTPANQFDASSRGMSNYGFLIINSSNYNIVRCNLVIGNAGQGSAGPANSTPGGGLAGSSGGGGSARGQNGCNTSNGTSAGTGGNGAAGSSAGSNNSNNGTNGNMGTGGPGLGTNNSTCCGRVDGNNGGTGGNGGAGGSWVAGNKPTAQAVANTTYYTPAGQSASGGNGGGGGGGSGSRGGTCSCVNCDGNPGSTGATGGAGGAGGAGGFGGGGAFGIWRSNSNTGANIELVNVQTLGAAGAGGLGANGRPGASGGAQTGRDCSGGCVCGNSCGGAGGAGGTGGAGGRGRDGADGVNAALVTNGTATATLTATIDLTNTVTLDNFSFRNNITGKMCNNSEIEMTKTTGSWILPSGLSVVKDLTSTTGSYDALPATIKVTTNSNNTFYDISNGTLLTKFLYTAPENRSLPAIVKSSNFICKGEAITLSTSNNYDISNIQQYEYVVFADAATAASPYQSGAYNSTSSNYTTPVFNTVGKYWVRYRERHNCCGWSRPVFTSFDVIDKPNAPATISISGGPYCYDGSAKSFTITIPGSSFAYPTYDSWELFDEDPSVGTPTPLQTSTSVNPSFVVTTSVTKTYYIRGKNACDISSALSVVAVVSGDPSESGVLATTTSSRTCLVSGSNWHYFRNSAGQIIAGINSNGQNLGNVTMAVTIETVPHDGIYLSPKHGNGGMGRDGSCLGSPELSMRRWYTITPTNQPAANNPATIKLYFTNADYTNYSNEIASWQANFASSYYVCYGYTLNASDLAVSKNESIDIPIESVALSGGPNNSNTYQLSIPSFSTFRFHTSGGIGEPLPVELISFIGWNQGSVNRLQWKTASELNSNRFEVERSSDGLNWIYLGAKNATGNSNQPVTYDFTDNNPVTGNNYYRLKIIDNDNTFKYSNIINININNVLTNGFVNVYPNPTDGNITVELQTTDSYLSLITVVDILGKEVFADYRTLEKGLNSLQFNFNSLAKGTYIIRFNDNTGKMYSTKFVKD